MTHPLLIADIGGTNARFAFAQSQAPYFTHAQTFQCEDFDNVEPAIETYLQTYDIKQVSGLCFAVAGAIVNDNINFTNNHWKIKSSDLKARYKTDNVKLLNDFQAIAYSLIKLEDDDLLAVGCDKKIIHKDAYTYGVIGPGSGLGVAGLIKTPSYTMPIISEAGHIGFSAENSQQLAVLHYLLNKFGRVSAERVLSGPGLMNIHEALCHIHGIENPGFNPSEIMALGINGEKPICQQSTELYFELLGQIAGDTALMFNARDGVFIGGGIIQRYPEYLINSQFRKGFEHKGRHRSLMESIPTWLITRKNPGLVGCSVYCYHL